MRKFLILFLLTCYFAFSQVKLVNIKDFITDIVIDLRYSTEKNFTGKVLYSKSECYIAKEVAVALQKVNEELKKIGYKLKIYDGYRPLSVQIQLWEAYPNPKFIANPKKGSVHNKGYAIDVSLVNLNNEDVIMPTDFDEFTEKANPSYMNLPIEAIKNREILQTIMKKYGFEQSKTEWWHFNYKGHKNKPLLDIPLDKIN